MVVTELVTDVREYEESEVTSQSPVKNCRVLTAKSRRDTNIFLFRSLRSSKCLQSQALKQLINMKWSRRQETHSMAAPTCFSIFKTTLQLPPHSLCSCARSASSL